MTKPATPLPWRAENHQFRAVIASEQKTRHVAMHGNVNDPRTADDFAYIVHACNTYPRLIEALRGMDPSAPLGNELTWEKARALLRELGEE